MIKRNTWILLGIFVILLGATWYMQTNNIHLVAPTAVPTSAPQAALLSIDETAIASVRIQSSQGKIVGIGRDSTGKWTITEPKAGPADETKTQSAISQLATINTTTTLGPTTDLNIYGLTNAAYTINVNMNGGKKYVLVVGDVTPTQDGYYVRLDQNPPQVVSKYSLTSLLGLLDNPPYQATATPGVTATAPVTATLPAAAGTVQP